MEKALDAITQPLQFAPASHCSRKCLKAQLEAYYKDCKGEDVKATSGSEGGEEKKGLTKNNDNHTDFDN